MQKLCILTDNSVQFTQSVFPGNDLVKIIPFSHLDSRLEELQKKPDRKKTSQEYQLLGLFKDLMGEYHEILVITLSHVLSDLLPKIEKALTHLGNPGNIRVFDSGTTSIGLGVLVQKVANLAKQGASSKEIDQQLRDSIPLMFNLLFLPDLNILADANFLSPAQAIVGNMLGFQPIYSLDSDCLKPIRKVRTQRQVLETFQEFLDEFSEPEYVAMVKADENSYKNIAAYLDSHFPAVNWGEHKICPSLIELFGSQAVGLFVSEAK